MKKSKGILSLVVAAALIALLAFTTVAGPVLRKTLSSALTWRAV